MWCACARACMLCVCIVLSKLLSPTQAISSRDEMRSSEGCQRVHYHSRCVAMAERIDSPKPPTSPTQKTGTNVARTNKIGMKMAEKDEDAPNCEMCGQTFQWNQLHLRWKHKCEPTPDPPQQQQHSFSPSSHAGGPALDVLMAGREEQLSGASKHVVKGETDSVSRECQCRKAFAGIRN